MSHSDQPPVLRPPTRTERLAKRLRGRWPVSYVHARLDHHAAVEAWAATAPDAAVFEAFISTPLSPDNDAVMLILNNRMRT